MTAHLIVQSAPDWIKNVPKIFFDDITNYSLLGIFLDVLKHRTSLSCELDRLIILP